MFVVLHFVGYLVPFSLRVVVVSVVGRERYVFAFFGVELLLDFVNDVERDGVSEGVPCGHEFV